MFTGIVTDKGTVIETIVQARGLRIKIATSYPLESLVIGASIACAGACLTITGCGIEEGIPWFTADVSEETLAKTTLGTWSKGTAVNLERPLRFGDELGGHLVSGHVDGMAEVEERKNVETMARFSFRAPPSLARFIAVKGSVTLDGVSLTVNEAREDRFTVMLIPHTLAVTTLGALKVGETVNIEVDLIARYLARLREME